MTCVCVRESVRVCICIHTCAYTHVCVLLGLRLLEEFLYYIYMYWGSQISYPYPCVYPWLTAATVLYK